MANRNQNNRSRSKSKNQTNRSNSRSNRRNRQSGGTGGSGGGAQMPLQYFVPDANVPRYYPAGHQMLGHNPNALPPKACYMSHGFEPHNPYVKTTAIQTGGAENWQFITNPETNRKVNVHSKKGKQVVTNYLNNLK
jgi:hypothetical protein